MPGNTELFRRIKKQLSDDELRLLTHQFRKWSNVMRSDLPVEHHELSNAADLSHVIESLTEYQRANRGARAILGMKAGEFNGMKEEETRIIAIRRKLEQLRENK